MHPVHLVALRAVEGLALLVENLGHGDEQAEPLPDLHPVESRLLAAGKLQIHLESSRLLPSERPEDVRDNNDNGSNSDMIDNSHGRDKDLGLKSSISCHVQVTQVAQQLLSGFLGEQLPSVLLFEELWGKNIIKFTFVTKHEIKIG